MQTRPLHCITQEEGQALFAAAFGYVPPTAVTIKSLFEVTYIGDSVNSMNLYPSGQFTASFQVEKGQRVVCVNIRNLISTLDIMNVDFGSTANLAAL